MTGAGEVAARNLEVSAVDVAPVEGDAAVDCNFFGGAAPHGVVGALDECCSVFAGEADGAVFGVVFYAPNAGGGFD